MTLLDQALKRRAESIPEYADIVKAQAAKRQSALMRRVIGRTAVDIAQVVDVSGDAVYLWFFCAGKTPGEGEKVVVLLQLIEQAQQRQKLEEAVHRKGVYYLADGRNLAEAVRDGAYNF